MHELYKFEMDLEPFLCQLMLNNVHRKISAVSFMLTMAQSRTLHFNCYCSQSSNTCIFLTKKKKITHFLDANVSFKTVCSISMPLQIILIIHTETHPIFFTLTAK